MKIWMSDQHLCEPCHSMGNQWGPNACLRVRISKDFGLVWTSVEIRFFFSLGKIYGLSGYLISREACQWVHGTQLFELFFLNFSGFEFHILAADS